MVVAFERAAALAKGRYPEVLDTLAAAYASAGRFEEAVTVQERAIALAVRLGRVGSGATVKPPRTYQCRDYLEETLHLNSPWIQDQ